MRLPVKAISDTRPTSASGWFSNRITLQESTIAEISKSRVSRHWSISTCKTGWRFIMRVSVPEWLVFG
jgi:hypothetical protein